MGVPKDEYRDSIRAPLPVLPLSMDQQILATLLRMEAAMQDFMDTYKKAWLPKKQGK